MQDEDLYDDLTDRLLVYRSLEKLFHVARMLEILNILIAIGQRKNFNKD